MISSVGFTIRHQHRFVDASRIQIAHRAITVPRLINPSFWQTILPKSRGHNDAKLSIRHRWAGYAARPWNPATYFVVMALLVGSNAIQLIALKRETLRYTRQTEAKLALLKEVIGRVQSGEDVDVEGLLGTGQTQHEQEWEQVIQEVEKGEGLWQAKAKRRELRAQRAIDQKAMQAQESSSQRSDTSSAISKAEIVDEIEVKQTPGFY